MAVSGSAGGKRSGTYAVARGWPVIRPALGASIPASSRSSVDLPQPLAPAIRRRLRPTPSSRIGAGPVQASPATSSASGLRRPVKKGTSSRTCLRASEPRRWRMRSTMRCSSSASKARIHS
jgi:hypothetical protein